MQDIVIPHDFNQWNNLNFQQQSTSASDDSREGFVQVTDKSCVPCRTRKVRCDRLAQGCLRCKNRREQCVYDKGVALVMRRLTDALLDPVLSKSETPPPPISYLLPDTNNNNNFLPPSPAHSPFVPDSQMSSSYSSGPIPQSYPAQGVQGQRLKYLDSRRLAGEVSSQWDSFLASANIGTGSVDWQLARPAMAKSLTITLLEASMHSCCLHLKAFQSYRTRISYFCEHLDSLSPSEEAAVTILTSLGARASPHSALLGVAGPDIENGRSTLALNLSAGVRRENAWRKIVDRAVDQCSRLNILHVPTKENVETLVALSNALLFSEVIPDRSRLFHRIAVGLFQDLQRSDLDETDLNEFKSRIGPPLYETDCRISAYAALPFLLKEIDVFQDLEGSGVELPDLDSEDLMSNLERILMVNRNGGRSRQQIEDALSLSGYYVCALQRTLSSLTATRRSKAYLTEMEIFWDKIDRVHGALQWLHRLLDGLRATGCRDHAQGHEHDMDFNRVLTVRLDIRIVDLINLSHCFLEKQRVRMNGQPESRVLEGMLGLSLKRVRKSLKLMAYYSKFLADSVDKHVVYHLVTQLEVIPWVLLAVQRAGEPGGPTSTEYEVSEIELDWFSEALKLACFFTPLAAERLEQMTFGRGSRRVFYQNPAAENNAYAMPSPIPSPTPGFPTPGLFPYPDFNSPFNVSRRRSLGGGYEFPFPENGNGGTFLRELGANDPAASAEFLAGFDFDALRKAASIGSPMPMTPSTGSTTNSNLPIFDDGLWNGTVQW